MTASGGIPATRPCPTHTPIAARIANVATPHGGAFARSASRSAAANGSTQSTSPIAPRSEAACTYASCTPHSCLRVGNASGETFGNFRRAAGNWGSTVAASVEACQPAPATGWARQIR